MSARWEGEFFNSEPGRLNIGFGWDVTQRDGRDFLGMVVSCQPTFAILFIGARDARQRTHRSKLKKLQLRSGIDIAGSSRGCRLPHSRKVVMPSG